ncbi:MAG: pantoate--beta-alanine ligase, partial [Silvanigrellaceae bacterium]|nr:pantoate--beta-alanine ligase [Silvanigrellaceae bacterium]
DCSHPTEIISVPTVREQDGLAMSSRNRYLKPQAIEIAKAIPLSLATCAKAFLNGERNVEKILQIGLNILKKYDLKPQYFELRQTSDLQICNFSLTSQSVIAIAQEIQYEHVTTRLIDNIILAEDTHSRQVLTDLIKRALNE